MAMPDTHPSFWHKKVDYWYKGLTIVPADEYNEEVIFNRLYSTYHPHGTPGEDCQKCRHEAELRARRVAPYSPHATLYGIRENLEVGL